MSLVEKLQVSFRVTEGAPTITPYNGPEVMKTTKCKWPDVMKGIEQFYPDMKIEDPKQVGDIIKFSTWFTNRPTKEPDVKWRLYNFFSYNPTMKVSGIEVKPIRY